MNLARRSTLALAVAIFLAACGGASGEPAATVNDEAIPVADVQRVVERQLAAAGVDPDSLPAEQRAEQVGQAQRSVLTSLIRVAVVRQLAEERGIEVSEEDVDAQLELAQSLQGGEEGVAALIERLGLTAEEYRELVIADLARQVAIGEQLAGGPVSEEDLRAAYEERAGQFTDATVRHILVASEAEAEDVLAQLESGADFAELAQQVSTDPSAEQGGDLGTQPVSNYVPEFAAAVQEADPGDIVGPVETQFGWHVIQVVDKQQRSFEDVRAQLRQQLLGEEVGQELNQVLQDAFAAADISVSPRFGEWNAEQLVVVPSQPIGAQTPTGTGTAPAPAGTPAPPTTTTPAASPPATGTG